MIEEIFGPVLTVYLYDDEDFDNVLKICDEASPYALTGSIFSSNEENIHAHTHARTHARTHTHTHVPQDVSQRSDL